MYMATPRQEKAAKLFMENGGKSLSKAMRDAGYSESHASNPQKLKESKSWEELLEKYLPDKKLVQVHKDILDTRELIHEEYPHDIEDEEIEALVKSAKGKLKKIKEIGAIKHVWFWRVDRKAQAGALDLAYKIKGKHKAQLDANIKAEVDGKLDLNLVNYADVDLDAVTNAQDQP